MVGVLIGVALAAQLGAVPELYRGRWSTDLAACGGEDTNGVVIEARTITFYEARGVVRSASEGSKGASAKVDFSGEGRTWSEAIRLRPLADKRLELSALGRTMVFERCPTDGTGT